MNVLCLDLEGVLIPEIWQAVAAATGVTALEKTTRDIPVYTELMDHRLAVLKEHDIGVGVVREEIDRLDPLPGAVDFLAWARQRFQVAIVSDTFYDFAMPLMRKLGWPMLFCHRLQIDGDRILGYHIRQSDPKRKTVQALHSMNYTVYAAGDSFNDVSMLEEADHGFFFQAPEHIREQFPQYPWAADYLALQELLNEGSAG